MRKATHTPGPWSLSDFEVSGDISGAAICRVLEADDFPCIEEGTEEDVQAECEANARLIAAAPDMLSALKGIKAHAEEEVAGAAADQQAGDLDAMKRSQCWSDVLNAIAKAEASE